jgi:hypothetical protein
MLGNCTSRETSQVELTNLRRGMLLVCKHFFFIAHINVYQRLQA